MYLYSLISSISDFFSRASRNQPLTPAQRAFLRAMDGAAITIFVPALQIIFGAIWQWYNNQTLAVDWNAVFQTALHAAMASALFVVVKYVRAHGGDFVTPLTQGDTVRIEPGHVAVNAPDGLTHIVEASAVMATPGANGTNYPKEPQADVILAPSQPANGDVSGANQ